MPCGLNRHEPCPGRHIEHVRADRRRKEGDERFGEWIGSGRGIPRVAFNALRPFRTPPLAGQRRLIICPVHPGTISES
jgi:hypothetical protein